MQLNLSTTATLRTEESGHFREVKTRVNVWTVRQKNSRCREVAVSGGWTVFCLSIIKYALFLDLCQFLGTKVGNGW